MSQNHLGKVILFESSKLGKTKLIFRCAGKMRKNMQRGAIKIKILQIFNRNYFPSLVLEDRLTVMIIQICIPVTKT